MKKNQRDDLDLYCAIFDVPDSTPEQEDAAEAEYFKMYPHSMYLMLDSFPKRRDRAQASQKNSQEN